MKKTNLGDISSFISVKYPLNYRYIAMPIVLVSPSQTSFNFEMGQKWIRDSPAAAKVIQDADRILGKDTLGIYPSALLKQSFSTVEKCNDSMARTDIPQICIYMASMACWAGLQEAGICKLGDIVAGFGLSFGELVLLTIAEAISFEDGLKFVCKRARIMQETVEASAEGGVFALVTTNRVVIDDVIAHTLGTTRACSSKKDVCLSVLRVKNKTSLLTGHASVVSQARDYARQKHNVDSFLLKDCAAFHSKLMNPAAERIALEMDNLEFEMPIFPIFSNFNAVPYTIDNARSFLANGIVSEIQWRPCCEKIIKLWPDATWMVLEPGQSVANETCRSWPQIQDVKCFDS